MTDCVFCKIINREIPAKIVYEDENIIAFDDINKSAPIHILVIPKEHIESALGINEDNTKIIGQMHIAINYIAKQQGFDKTGFRLINNCGEDAGQIVKHLHYHILAGKDLGSKIL